MYTCFCFLLDHLPLARTQKMKPCGASSAKSPRVVDAPTATASDCGKLLMEALNSEMIHIRLLCNVGSRCMSCMHLSDRVVGSSVRRNHLGLPASPSTNPPTPPKRAKKSKKAQPTSPRFEPATSSVTHQSRLGQKAQHRGVKHAQRLRKTPHSGFSLHTCIRRLRRACNLQVTGKRKT